MQNPSIFLETDRGCSDSKLEDSSSKMVPFLGSVRPERLDARRQGPHYVVGQWVPPYSQSSDTRYRWTSRSAPLTRRGPTTPLLLSRRSLRTTLAPDASLLPHHCPPFFPAGQQFYFGAHCWMQKPNLSPTKSPGACSRLNLRNAFTRNGRRVSFGSSMPQA